MASGTSHTRLEKSTRSGMWEIRWSERRADGSWRTRALSTRTADKSLAETVRRKFERAEAQAAAEEIAGGGVGVAGQRTVGDILRAYSATAASRGVGPTQLKIVRGLDGFFGWLTVAQITPDVVLDYRARRGVSDGTVRRELGVLTAALRWAHGRGLLGVGVIGAPVIDLPPAGEARAVFLNELIEEELWQLASRDVDGWGRLSRVGIFICVGLETGARKSAIEGLTWDRVDLARGVIDFRDPSMRATKKRRVATPITDRLRPVLERALRERKGTGPGRAFVTAGVGDIRKTWSTFMDKHGFEDMTPHVLRHTRITLLLRAGVPVWDVSALVGASPEVIHSTYGHHVADRRLAAQANRRHVAAAA